MATAKTLALALILLFLGIVQTVSAGSGPPGCTSPTVVDGYVYFANGTAVQGASMTVTTTASNCNSWTDTTDINGYYSIPGLDINGKTVTSTATISTYDGTNSSAVSASTVRLNIWIRPKAPTLTAIADRHNGTNIVMSWTSGSEIAAGESTTDYLDNSSGTYVAKTSPQTVTFSSFTTYTWRVKTCNSKICSAISSDSFDISNSAPSSPTLPDLNYTNATSMTFTWTSGTDSDTGPADTVHDEFQLSNVSDYSVLVVNDTSATSPKTVTNLTLLMTYYWRVRTCDNSGASNACSSWATDSFFTYNGSEAGVAGVCLTCPTCPSAIETGGGGGIAVYSVALFAPSQLAQGDGIALLVSFKSDRNIANLTFSVIAPAGITMEPANIKGYKFNTDTEVVLKGKVADDLAEGSYTLRLMVYSGNTNIATKEFKIEITKTLKESVCGNNICESGETAENCIQDCQAIAPFSPAAFWLIVLIIALSAIAAHMYKDITRKARELEKYFHSRLKRGEKPESVRNKLMNLGYSAERVTKTYDKLKRKHHGKIHKGEPSKA